MYKNLVVTGLVATMMLAACGQERSPITAGNDPGTTASTVGDLGDLGQEAGFGAPVQDGAEFVAAGTPYRLSGSLSLADNGCWYFDLSGTRRLVVLPTGYHLDDVDSTVLRGPDGIELRSGDQIDGTGWIVPEDALSGGGDGRWENQLAFCRPSPAELMVFDEVEHGFDPTALTRNELAEMIENAVFDQHWPCGRGWAASTSDQRVGLLIYQIDDRQPTPGPLLTLPDPGWTAEVIVGKNQFVSHCDDALEEWVPESLTVARFPITATVELTDTPPDNDDPPRTVAAILSRATIEVDKTVISLPEIPLRNDAYNAFAG